MRAPPLRTALLVIGALLFCLAPQGFARTFFEQRYGTRDGLPSDLVKSVARDRFGFIWLATDAGLVRFDGTSFSTYEDDLPFPFGKGLHLTRSGRLLAFGDAGLVEISGTPARVRFSVLFGTDGPPGATVLSAPRGLLEDGRGRLWLSEPRAIVRVDGDHLIRYELGPSSHSQSFLRSYCLAEDGLGTLWAASQTGELFRFEEDGDRFVPVEIEWPVDVLHQLRGAAPGVLWAATARGLFEVRVREGGRLVEVLEVDDTPEVSFVGRAGPDVLLTTFGVESYVGRIEEGRFSPQAVVQVFIVQHVFEDEDGSLWLSTDEGVLRLRPTVFEQVRLVDRRLERFLVSYAQTSDGTIYACDRGNVYRLVHGDRGATAEPLLDEPTEFLFAVQTDGRFVWASHGGGVMEFDGDRLVRNVRLRSAYAADLQRGPDSSLWLITASDDRVLRIASDGSRQSYGVEEGVPARPLALAQSSTGELFVATNDPSAVLVRYDAPSDSFVRVIEGLPFAPGGDFNVYDLAIDGSGRAWVASTAGLLEIGERVARRVAVGWMEGSPGAQAVAVDDGGSVWFATGLGVIRFDPETGEQDLFDEDSGLPSRVVGVRDLYPAPGGGVTASTARGVARFVGGLAPRRELPPPALLDVRIDDRPVEPDAPDLSVSYGGYLEVLFSSPLYGPAPDYQIRLEGRDDAWRKPESRKDVLLAGLDSGPYTLWVRAVLQGSDRASPPTGLSFTVERPWYETGWTLLLAVAAFGAVAWAASAVKSWGAARREQRLRALVDERTGELSEANRLLGERNAEMERFIYTVSHDLKSPLISISGFIGLLERDLERGHLDGAGDSVARVKASASRMSTLLDELLEMSRVGRVRDDPGRVEPGPLVNEVTREMAPRLAERGVEVSVQPDIPTVWADRSRLRQVLQNLLDNAEKFLGDQAAPRIEVGGTSENGRARLFVRDNGIGIEPAHHEAAFELFRRLHLKSEGTGVGLSLVKRIVEVHGGRVWIESEGRPGRGTTVWVELPREPTV